MPLMPSLPPPPPVTDLHSPPDTAPAVPPRRPHHPLQPQRSIGGGPARHPAVSNDPATMYASQTCDRRRRTRNPAAAAGGGSGAAVIGMAGDVFYQPQELGRAGDWLPTGYHRQQLLQQQSIPPSRIGGNELTGTTKTTTSFIVQPTPGKI